MASPSFILWDCLTTLELKYPHRYLENTVIWEADTIIMMKFDDGNQWDFFKYYKASEWNQSPRQVEGSNTDKQERMRKVFVCPTALTEGGHHAQRCWCLWGYEKVLEEERDSCVCER